MEQEIRDCYARQGAELAQHWPLFGKWSANSQYGYALDWFPTRQEAERHALDYYLPRMNLIHQ